MLKKNEKIIIAVRSQVKTINIKKEAEDKKKVSNVHVLRSLYACAHQIFLFSIPFSSLILFCPYMQEFFLPNKKAERQRSNASKHNTCYIKMLVCIERATNGEREKERKKIENEISVL